MNSHVRAILEATGEGEASKAMSILGTGFYDSAPVLLLPAKYRKRLRTTSGIEGLSERIRRQERVIRVFPNNESVIRLLGTLLMREDEKWKNTLASVKVRFLHEHIRKPASLENVSSRR